MAKVISLRQKLQNLKKGSSSIGDYVMKIKEIGDALMSAGEKVKERDLVLSMLNGLGHDYDSVVVHIASQQQSIPLEEAQFLLVMHEQRIEQLNFSSQIDITGPNANFASNSFNAGRGKRGGNQNNNRGGHRGRGRGG
ncbi:hypothetical protein ACOSQ4_009374 [Xanthoceras sorbifolium]